MTASQCKNGLKVITPTGRPAIVEAVNKEGRVHLRYLDVTEFVDQVILLPALLTPYH